MTDISARQGDITTIEVDAIVNAANSRLAGGGGVDGAIHRAGGPVIAEQCRAWVSAHGRLPTGEAMSTDAGDLPARLVIHTVGPIWGEHEPEEARTLLASCYTNSLDLARERNCAKVAFPNISTGVYGFPKRDAAEVAVAAVEQWADDDDAIEEVIFVCFDDENLGIYSELLGS
jgi:O-acetyl-ADP-ribose deacetylase (regulator of RNase III)